MTKYSNEKIVMVKIELLKPAPHNPASRTRDNNLKKLMGGINSVGRLIYPITITKGYEIIDGHRRYTCCKKLGWKEVPCIIENNGVDPHTLYSILNASGSSRIMGGAEILQVYLKEPSAVSESVRAKLEKFEKQFGRAMLRKLAKKELSHNVIATAQRIGRYVNKDEDEFLGKVVEWLLKFNAVSFSDSYMKLGLEPKELYNAISKGREVKIA